MEGTVLEKLSVALGVSTTTIITVFGILIILILIIMFRSIQLRRGSEKEEVIKLSAKEEVSAVDEIAPLAQVIDFDKEYELVATIMAALSAHTGKSVAELSIKSIKRVNNNSSWRSASINGSHR